MIFAGRIGSYVSEAHIERHDAAFFASGHTRDALVGLAGELLVVNCVCVVPGVSE